MAYRPQFDPDIVACYEIAGWEAYYARDWVRTLQLMVRMNRALFNLNWRHATAASLAAVRAAKAFAPVDHDLAAVRRHLTSYFAYARMGAGLAADAATLADRELAYWVVHRDLAVRRQRNRWDRDIAPLVHAFARLHAALFGRPEAEMLASAEARALATVAVDRITGGYSEDIDADWAEAEHYLRQAYRAALPAATPAQLDDVQPYQLPSLPLIQRRQY